LKCYNRKSLFIGIVLIVLMTLIALTTIAGQFDINEILSAIGQTQLAWVMAAIICMLAFSFGESFNIYLGLRVSGHKLSIINAIKYSFAGFFFSSVTPSASGGQPAQLFFMKKDGIPIAHGTFALILELIGYECASVGLGMCGLIFKILPGKMIIDKKLGLTIIVAGFGVNILLLGGLLAILLSNKDTKIMSAAAIKATSHSAKSNAHRLSILRFFAEYRYASRKLVRQRETIVKIIMISFFRLMAYHSITFMVFKGMGLKGYTYWDITLLQGILFTAVSCIPLPGSAGAIEGGFGLVFSAIFPEAYLGSAIVLSRLINFLLPLAYTGVTLVVFNSIITRK